MKSRLSFAIGVAALAISSCSHKPNLHPIEALAEKHEEALKRRPAEASGSERFVCERKQDDTTKTYPPKIGLQVDGAEIWWDFSTPKSGSEGPPASVTVECVAIDSKETLPASEKGMAGWSIYRLDIKYSAKQCQELVYSDIKTKNSSGWEVALKVKEKNAFVYTCKAAPVKTK